MSSEAFVTSTTNDGYALGALVLAHSIRQFLTQRCLNTDTLGIVIHQKCLEEIFDEVLVVDELNPSDQEHLNLSSRPEFLPTYTKISCWLLVQYTKCVFIDANCLVLRSIDDLFNSEQFSAAPDADWPDFFSSGVFVYRPSKETFKELMELAREHNASFEDDDQRLLNSYFVNWRTRNADRRLSFVYNVDINIFHSNSSLAKRFRTDIRVIRFAGALRPWQLTFDSQKEQLLTNFNAQSDMERDFLLSWWRTMHQHVSSVIQRFNQQSSSNNETINEEKQFEHSFNPTLNYGNLTENTRCQFNFHARPQIDSDSHIDSLDSASFSNEQQQLQQRIDQTNGTSIRSSSSSSTNNGNRAKKDNQ